MGSDWIAGRKTSLGRNRHEDPHEDRQHHQFLQLKQQQQQQQQLCSPIWERQVKQNPQQILSGGRPVGIGNGRYNKPLGLPPSAWPPLQSQQPQNGYGMRAIFLGGSGTRRECSGTGVFLLRRNGREEKSPGVA